MQWDGRVIDYSWNNVANIVIVVESTHDTITYLKLAYPFRLIRDHRIGGNSFIEGLNFWITNIYHLQRGWRISFPWFDAFYDVPASVIKTPNPITYLERILLRRAPRQWFTTIESSFALLFLCFLVLTFLPHCLKALDDKECFEDLFFYVCSNRRSISS
jgi:hypothetical protein